MSFFDSMDPYFRQLLIASFSVIVLGVLSAIVSKKVLIGPAVTFILTILYNAWYYKHNYPQHDLDFEGLSGGSIIFSGISFLISWALIELFRKNKKAG
jgi:hypothetical protein